MSKKQILQDFIELPGGSKLYLLPISEADIQGIVLDIKRRFAERGLPLDPPTYKTPAEEVIGWDAESIEKDGTDKDKKAWAEHQEAVNLFNQEQVLKISYFILTESPYKLVTARGHEIDLIIDEVEGNWTPPQIWLERHQKLGYELPDNPYDRKFDYLKSVVKGANLFNLIAARATALNLRDVVSDEGVAKYEATFRGAMEKEKPKTEARLNQAFERISGMVEEGEGKG